MRRPASRRRVVRHNPEHVKKKVQDAIKHLHFIAADYDRQEVEIEKTFRETVKTFRNLAANNRRKADEIEAAWSNGDYEWLQWEGVISSRDLDAVNEEYAARFSGRNNPRRVSRRRK